MGYAVVSLDPVPNPRLYATRGAEQLRCNGLTKLERVNAAHVDESAQVGRSRTDLVRVDGAPAEAVGHQLERARFRARRRSPSPASRRPYWLRDCLEQERFGRTAAGDSWGTLPVTGARQ